MAARYAQATMTGLVVGWLALVPVAAARPAAPGPSSEPASEAPPASGGRVIDRVVAVIGTQVLTLSELEFEARVTLVQRGGVRAAEVSLDEQTLKGALELAINQRLLVGADRLQAFQAERSEVEARLRAFRERFEDETALLAFLARHDADLEQLTAVLERSVRAERILDSRIRLRAQVSEAEVRRYWEEHKGKLGGPFEAVRDTLKEKLFRDRYNQLAKDEFKLVRESVRIRRVAPFARTREGEP